MIAENLGILANKSFGKYKFSVLTSGFKPQRYMKSNLNKQDFKKRLAELTSKEDDFYFFTPYKFSGEPFCGAFDDDTFELTRNSFWRHVKAVVIKGEYKALDENSCEVTYTIGLTRFMRNSGIVIFCFFLVLFNAAIFINQASFHNPLLPNLLLVNGLIIFVGLWAFTINWVTKRIVSQRFKEEFEIDVVNEWERTKPESPMTGF